MTEQIADSSTSGSSPTAPESHEGADTQLDIEHQGRDLESNSTPEVEAESSSDEMDQRPKNREERYRKERGELRAENDSLRARLEKRDRADVERIASQHLADPADFWRDGATLADVLDENGDIDHGKVTELCTAVQSSHPHWKKPSPPAAPPASTVTSNGKIEAGEPPPSWTDLLQRKVR